MECALHERVGTITRSCTQPGALYHPVAEAAGDVPAQDVLLSRAMKQRGTLNWPFDAEAGRRSKRMVQDTDTAARLQAAIEKPPGISTSSTFLGIHLTGKTEAFAEGRPGSSRMRKEIESAGFESAAKKEMMTLRPSPTLSTGSMLSLRNTRLNGYGDMSNGGHSTSCSCPTNEPRNSGGPAKVNKKQLTSDEYPL